MSFVLYFELWVLDGKQNILTGIVKNGNCGETQEKVNSVPYDVDFMTSDPSFSERRRLVPPPANPNLIMCGPSNH